jgi:RNA polymerase sigma-70 factor (ECF subfamily)
MENEGSFLVNELKSGNKAAFEFVFKKYYDSLCLYSLKYLKEKSIAEDVVAGFFERFYEKRMDLNIQVSLKAYLFTSVRNVSINYLRDHKNKDISIEQISIDGDPIYYLGQKDAAFEKLLGEEVEKRIEFAIGQLPEQCQLIFRMSRFQGMKYREISEELDLSVKTVETQMSRALKKLRAELQDYLHLFII